MSIFNKISSKIPNKFKIGMKALTGKLTYNQDGLATQHNADFMNDPKFKEAYDLAVSHGLAVDPNIQWRAHVACWAALNAKNIGGDFVECGVNKGFLSKIICEYLDFNSMPNSKFYLLDTFEGLADKYISPTERAAGKTAGGYAACIDIVQREFKDYKNVNIIKGVIPETLEQVRTAKIAYLSIDLNNVIPEIAAAEYFWDRMMSGGMILLDDYNFKGFEEQHIAFDKFTKEKGTQVLSLPTGQGLIIKP
jgi:hypothetical protein